MNDKKDRRGERTRWRLGTAMIELIQEKCFDDITVQNVLDRAATGRATFYSHYRDKEDLFAHQWERVLDEIARRIKWDKAGHGSFVPIAFLFSHLQQSQHLYQVVVLANYLANELFALLKWWLDNRMPIPARRDGSNFPSTH